MSYEEKLKSSRVVIETDSQCASRVITVGSTKPHLQSLAMDICQLCFRQGISLETQWIPRSLNDKADVLSRFIDLTSTPNTHRLVAVALTRLPKIGLVAITGYALQPA